MLQDVAAELRTQGVPTRVQRCTGDDAPEIEAVLSPGDALYLPKLWWHQVEATGEVTKAGKSLIFARGQITTGDRMLMSFSGVIRKFTPRG